MEFTRSQIAAVFTALGLDPDLTTSVVIGPRTVYVEIAALEDGHPVVENGTLQLESHHIPITDQEVQE